MPDFENYGCRICNNPCCLNIVLSIIAALFFSALGLILGAFFSSTLLPAVAVIITAAVLLLVLFVIFLIIRNCNR